jgi:hypothetical protein
MLIFALSVSLAVNIALFVMFCDLLERKNAQDAVIKKAATNEQQLINCKKFLDKKGFKIVAQAVEINSEKDIQF